ncbi:DUF5324 family protein [Kitasatospora sp. NPDC052868]|uniref:DUF5324 family protein n=1 Tax=Kitasatospora sp. NPDC052868 TaxID=3364060 RepID=UPI0037C5C5DD
MTRLDSARETAGKTRDTLAPYAATAKDTAVHLADGAKQRLGPALDSIGPKASQAAHGVRVQYDRRIAPQLGHAFASLPPDAQENVLKAVHRTQEAALAARHSAARAADQARATVGPRVTYVVDGARSTVVPAAQEAQIRGAAALTALHGHVTSAEIGDLAARNRRKEQRNGWATGLAVAGALAIGGGILIWQWWRHQGDPEWLVEPSSALDPENGSQNSPAGGSAGAPAAHTGGAHAASADTAADAPVNGSAAASAQAGTPAPDPAPDKPGSDDERPKPHDPRKPH